MTVTSEHPAWPAISAGQKQEFRRDVRRKRLVSHLLVLPLLLFIALLFIGPILVMLSRSVENPELRAGLPTLAHNLSDWSGEGLPNPKIYQALAMDLVNPDLRSERAAAARRLNYEVPGYRTLVIGTARKIGQVQDEIIADPKAALIALDPRWGEMPYWHALRRAVSPTTSYYLLAALDLKVDDSGSVVRVEPEQRIFVDILMRSLWVSVVVTAVCLLVAFPVANYIVVAGPRMRALVLLSILLPFWTSLLVRTSAWIVVLQREGLVNDVLTGLSLVDDPLELIFNRFGVYVAMIHILLPFMVLPLYSVMQGIPSSYMRAAASLGARPLQAFWRVYLPMTLPGIGAGCLLTFILAVGYYITPALVGGAQDQMIGYFIAFFTNTRLNWGMASALSFILLSCILVLYVGLGRYVGIGRLVGIDK
ncbi:ABC transporter permease [Tritonibacter mobilis]|nr:ABC transporter permease [Tritonibacter mobilis]